MARYSPPTSALYRATHPEWRITDDTLLLRDIEFRLRVLDWRETRDGHDGINPPKWFPLTKAEKDAEKSRETVGDPLPLPDMLAWLGWSKPSPN